MAIRREAELFDLYSEKYQQRDCMRVADWLADLAMIALCFGSLFLSVQAFLAQHEFPQLSSLTYSNEKITIKDVHRGYRAHPRGGELMLSLKDGSKVELSCHKPEAPLLVRHDCFDLISEQDIQFPIEIWWAFSQKNDKTRGVVYQIKTKSTSLSYGMVVERYSSQAEASMYIWLAMFLILFPVFTLVNYEDWKTRKKRWIKNHDASGKRKLPETSFEDYKKQMIGSGEYDPDWLSSLSYGTRAWAYALFCVTLFFICYFSLSKEISPTLSVAAGLFSLFYGYRCFFFALRKLANK